MLYQIYCLRRCYWDQGTLPRSKAWTFETPRVFDSLDVCHYLTAKTRKNGVVKEFLVNFDGLRFI